MERFLYRILIGAIYMIALVGIVGGVAGQGVFTVFCLGFVASVAGDATIRMWESKK